ncbi:hypothetical protein GCM10009122_35530 [Fulvivirga kasyanovii]
MFIETGEDATTDPPFYPGALQGTFQVNSSGAATYNIPISVPPGIGKVAPKLAVAYTSNSGNGLLGMGFSMNGLASIQRTGATIAQDGFTGSVNYDDLDRFALNGSRLINTAGAYGADGSIYHTENESWKKVTAFGSCGSGPCRFEVITKKGYKLEYGGTEDAQVQSTSGKGIRVWALNKATDLAGNYMTFEYHQDAENGSYLLSEIQYTGNENTGLAPQRSVRFFYEDRTDVEERYEAGGVVRTTKRLTQISTYVDNTNVLNYLLDYTYSPATGRSQLVHIRECDAQQQCLPATEFSWQGGSPLRFTTPNVLAKQIKTGQLMPMDINGDGLIDFANVNHIGSEVNPTQINAYLSDGETFVTSDSINFSNDNGGAFYAVDRNGDGLGDLIKVSKSDGLTVTTFISNGKGFDPPADYVAPDTINFGSETNAFLEPADLNGDGLTDLVYGVIVSCSGDESQVRVINFLSTASGAGYQPEPSQTLTISSGCGAFNTLDVNGDGMSDLVYVLKDNYSKPFEVTPLFSSEGKSYVQGETQSFPFYKASGGDLLASDVNGDGNSELVYAYLGTDSLYLTTYFSTGAGFIPKSQSQKYPGSGWLMAAESNGDNHTDLLYVVSSNTDAFEYISYLSDGEAFQPGVPLVFDDVRAGLNPMPMDVNGDGLTDLLLTETLSGVTPHFQFTRILADTPYPDLVDSIDNGIGGLLEVAYKPLTDKQVYQMDQSLSAQGTYPVNSLLNRVTGETVTIGAATTPTVGAITSIMNVTLPSYAVANYVQTDGRGARYPYSYSYAGARVDRNGRGWLGFQRQTMTDSSAQNITHTYYRQPFPLSGKTDSSATYSLEGQILNKNQLGYEVKEQAVTGGTLYQVNQTRSRTYFYDDGRYAYTIATDYEYDDFGNVHLITDKGDTATATTLYTQNQYQNDTVNWRIGYLTQSFSGPAPDWSDTLSLMTMSYDPETQWVKNKQYWANASQWIDTSYVYDAYGNSRYIIDQAGDTTEIQYESVYHTFPSRRITPPNQWGNRLTTVLEFDPRFGKIKSVTDPNGSTINLFLDNLGRVSELQGPNPEGQMVSLAQISYLPNDVGYITQRKTLLNWEGTAWKQAKTYYDGLIRSYEKQTFGQDGLAVLQQIVYNSNDQVTARSLPYFQDSTAYWVWLEYDAADRIKQVSIPKDDQDSLITKVQYAGKSVVVTHSVGTEDEASMTLSYDYYNSSRKYTTEVNANNEQTLVYYDLLGRPYQITDPQNIETQIEYDGQGRMTKLIDASLGTNYFRYNDLNRKRQIITANQDTIEVYEDALGRPLRKQTSAGQNIQYQYDLKDHLNTQGQLAKVIIEPGFYYTYTYDRLGNPDSTTLYLDRESYTQVQTYNPDQSVASLVFPDEAVQSYHYTPEGLLESITLLDAGASASTSQSLIQYQQYDARNEVLKALYGNQVSEQYAYSPIGKLISYSLKQGSGASISDKRYQWNDALQIHTINDLVDPAYDQTYTYDPTGRLLTAEGIYGNKTYAYDHSGNLTLKDGTIFSYENYQVMLGTSQANATDTIFAAQYDPIGNRKLSQVNEGGHTASYVYQYDAFNQLRQVEKDGRLLYTYLYDHEGRRVRKTNFTSNVISTYASPNFEVTQYADSTVYTKNILNEDGLIATISQQKSSTDRAVQEVDRSTGLPQSGTLYFHQDHIGNTRLTTSGQGTVSSQLEYLPYGQIYQPESSGPDNFRYKFGGKELDEGGGLYYFNARYYDPVTGRFITSDTQLGGHPWQADVLNRYAYVLNNPIKYNDPSGHSVAGDILMGVTVAVTAVAEVGVAVATAGAAIPEEVAMDAGAVVAVGAEATAEVGIEAGIDAGIETGADALAEVGTDAAGSAIGETSSADIIGGGSADMFGNDAVDGATESLSGCDCGVTNEQGESMCFVAGTLVQTEHGLVSIDSIRKGDLVWTWNEARGTDELNAVTETSQREAHRLIEIYLAGDTITATPEHPFWTQRGWKPALWLNSDDTLGTADGQVQVVRGTSLVSDSRIVYNFTVEHQHNYRVSTAGVLVHNVGGCNTNVVYQGTDAQGNVRYIGITNRPPEKRFAEHGRSGSPRSTLDYSVINGSTNLSRTDARVQEQTLINQYGMKKNGGALENRINSIAPKHWNKHGIQ